MGAVHSNGKGTAVLRATLIKADGRTLDLGVLSTTPVKWYDIKGRLILRRMKKLGE